MTARVIDNPAAAFSIKGNETFFDKEFCFDLEMKIKHLALKIASYALDPVCKIREHFYSLYIVSYKAKTTTKKVILVVSIVFWMSANVIIAPLTAPIGLAIKTFVKSTQSYPYLFVKQNGEGKNLPETQKISVLSYNVCFMPGGYSISDGQVMPSSDRIRMEENLKKIEELDPDVVCLYEVPDICDADYLSHPLSAYPYLIPVAGIKAIGPSSMMYVASKYEIPKDSICFDPFIKRPLSKLNF